MFQEKITNLQNKRNWAKNEFLLSFFKKLGVLSKIRINRKNIENQNFACHTAFISKGTKKNYFIIVLKNRTNFRPKKKQNQIYIFFVHEVFLGTQEAYLFLGNFLKSAPNFFVAYFFNKRSALKNWSQFSIWKKKHPFLVKDVTFGIFNMLFAHFNKADLNAS